MQNPATAGHRKRHIRHETSAVACCEPYIDQEERDEEDHALEGHLESTLHETTFCRDLSSGGLNVMNMKTVRDKKIIECCFGSLGLLGLLLWNFPQDHASTPSASLRRAETD